MDSDTSLELMAQGRDRLRLNVRVMSSDNGNDGSAETMNGNTAVSYSLPSGNNTVIGAKEDKLRRKIYYFVYNASNNHSILEFDSITNTIALVFQDTLLNFNMDYLITGIDFITLDLTNHLMYWTDNYNEPRKINIEKAKFYSTGDHVNGYKTPFEARWITRIKQPCPTPPTAAWSNDSSQLINYLFKKNFTFKIQFFYDDNDVSSYSPISNYAFPVTVSDGTGEDIQTQYNALTVTVATGSSIVTKIRVVAKETNGEDYTVIADLDKSVMGIGNDTTYAFTFYNNGNYAPIEINESIKLFDSVPLLSKSQALIPGNYLTDGLITEGYDPVSVDTRFLLTYVLPGTYPVNPDFFPKQTFLKSGGAYLLGFVYFDDPGNRSGVTNIVNQKTTMLIDPAINVYGTRLFIPFVTETAYTIHDMSYVPNVGVQIYHRPPTWAKYYQVLRSKNEVIDRYIQFAAANVIYYADDKTSIVLPAAAAYVGVFVDNIAGRYKFENPNSVLVYDFVKGDRIRFIANNNWTDLDAGGGAFAAPIAPAGGNDIAANYTTSLPNSSTTLRAFFSFNDNEIVSYDTGTSMMLIKMNSSIPNNLWPGVLFEVYQPAENVIDNNEIMYEMGECRPIITDAHGNLVHKGTAGLSITNQLITTFSASTYVSPTFTATVPVGHGLLVTRNVKVVTTGYSVFGQVTASGATSVTIDTTGFTLVGVFNGATAGTITAAAQFSLAGGDCFRRYQDMPIVLNDVNRLYQYVEAENASNMFPSEMWNVGRPNRVDPEYRQIVRPSTIYNSQAFIPETFINGLSTVYDTSFQTYEDKYGGIYKLSNRNHQLTVYQELKVGGLPVGQVVFNGTDGGSVVGQSTEVLPSVMEYYDADYGIGIYPESHATYGSVEYFMDVKRGTPVRLSNDGLTPLADVAFMRNFFTDLCTQIMWSSRTKININGVYDAKFNEYVIAFDGFTYRNITVSPRTLAFNERTNAWSSFYSFSPEFMCTDGINIVSWSLGAFYTHNTNSLQANFYGTQYQPELWVVLNDNPSNVKVLEAISEEGLLPWEVYSIASLSGQASSLVVGDFAAIENIQYAPVLRDSNTPNVVAPALAIFAGDPMRDRAFLCKFRLTGTAYNKLFAVNFQYIMSNLNNR